MRVLTVLLLTCSVATLAQHSAKAPQFNDYPSLHIYHGKPAPPILSKDQRTFRTQIREGANAPVEFGGHYTIPRWGCGSGCSGFAIVDSISGKVYDAPFAISELPGAWLDDNKVEPPERMEFRPDSRL